MKALVTKVIDGDTFDVLLEGLVPDRVRIAEFNAPEMETLSGLLAQGELEAKILRHWVKLVPKARDNYGRMVADVYLLN